MIKEILNKIISNILYVAIIAAVIFGFIFYRSYKNTKAELKEQKQVNEELVTKYDSIIALPPDTIIKPIEIRKDSFIYRTVFVSNIDSSSFEIYNDSIKNDSIDLNVTIRAQELYDISYAYRPIYRYQEKIIEKNIPYPVETIKEIKVKQRGFFINAGLGYGNNDNSLSTVDNIAFKAGLMLLTNKSNTFNVDYVRYDKNNIFTASYGIKM